MSLIETFDKLEPLSLDDLLIKHTIYVFSFFSLLFVNYFSTIKNT